MKLSHAYIRSFLLSLFFLIAAHVKAQEICNNGVDDDHDGLTDLYDPDCQCRFTVTGNLLQNASFESYDHCPASYTYTNDHNIINAWEYGTYTNINEATFYHNLKCPYDSNQVMLNMPPSLPLPDGNAFISIVNMPYLDNRPEKDMTKSYVGQCLQTPLVKGESYTLSFDAGRFRSWDNLTGKIFPFTVAVFGNADCTAVPFGKVNAAGNGCPSNYNGWHLLGKTTMYSNGQWVQGKVNLKVPYDIHVIEVGVDCSILESIHDLTDSTTYMDYHVYYLDDLHLLRTKDFPFQYIQTQLQSGCTGLAVLQAPNFAGGSYQWYKDSVAIAGATAITYQVTDTTGQHYYNVMITTSNKCITSEPFFLVASKLYDIHIPADTTLCMNDTMILAPVLDGISYTINGEIASAVSISKEGSYTIAATDIYGCQKTFTTKVSLQNCNNCDPFVPTAFTPNGDGLNDLFKAKVNCALSQFHLRIFNRWGKTIFETGDINRAWDGTLSGIKLPPGTYVYLIDYKTKTGAARMARGTIVLMM